MKIKNLGKNYLEKNKTSPLLKTPEKDFHGRPRNVGTRKYEVALLASSKEGLF